MANSSFSYKYWKSSKIKLVPSLDPPELIILKRQYNLLKILVHFSTQKLGMPQKKL